MKIKGEREKMKDKNIYREWSKELFQEEENTPIYHSNGTISFITNCYHSLKGIRILLPPSSKEPCVFCANCGGWITTLKQWQEWDQEHRERYKDPFQPKIQLSFSTSDVCLRSFRYSEPIGELVEITFLDPPIKKARGLFRNLGEKITQAIRENEKWNEFEFVPMFIPNQPWITTRNKSQTYDFSTIVEISELLLEEGEKK